MRAQGRFSSPPVHIQGAHLPVETLAFVRPHAPPDRGPLGKTHDVRLGSPESSARKQHENERRKEEDDASCPPMHLQALRTRAGDRPAAILFRIGSSLDVVQVAQKQPHALSFLRATLPRFGMTILFGGQNYTTTNSSASAWCTLEIVYNKKCCLRPDDESRSKATDNHFLPLHVL